MKASNSYDFTLTAGGSFILPVSGSYFRILTSTGALDVRGDFGRIGVLAGQGHKELNFTKLTLVDKSGAANVGTIFVSDGAFIDDRITGEVSVIDGGKEKTKSGIVFGSRLGVGAVAAQLSEAQLFNPASSGKRLIISSFSGIAGGNGVYFGIGSVQLATLSLAPQNKLSGGVAAITQGRIENNAALVAMTLMGQAASGVQVKELEPYVILPGYGFCLVANDVNTNLFASFHISEESI